MALRHPSRKNFFLVASLIFILDRLTKYLVLASDFERIEVLPILSLVKVWNRGMAFGFFSSAESVNLFFALTTSLILLVIFFLAQRASLLDKLGYSLVFGGGLGNLVDRIVFSGVLDFIDLHVGNLHWPAFNVADLAITAGVFFLILNKGKGDAPKGHST